MDTDVWRWLWSVGAIFLALGGLSLGGFVLLPFAIGAAAAAVLAWIGTGVLIQWLAFFGVSVLSLGLMRRFIQRQDERGEARVGSNRWIGATGVVLQGIDPTTGEGMVRVLNEEWRATASRQIPKGARVLVRRVTGTRVVVEEIESQ